MSQEVDFLIGEQAAVEVKASRRTTERDAGGLAALAEEGVFKQFYVVNQDPAHRRKKIGLATVEFVPYELFLERLWNGRLEGLP